MKHWDWLPTALIILVYGALAWFMIVNLLLAFDLIK